MVTYGATRRKHLCLPGWHGGHGRASKLQGVIWRPPPRTCLSRGLPVEGASGDLGACGRAGQERLGRGLGLCLWGAQRICPPQNLRGLGQENQTSDGTAALWPPSETPVLLGAASVCNLLWPLCTRFSVACVLYRECPGGARGGSGGAALARGWSCREDQQPHRPHVCGGFR